MKKIQITLQQLQSENDIWNAVSNVAIEHVFPTNEPLLDELSILVLYFNEMESGGHEAVLTWTSEAIEQLGFPRYLASLTATLEKIGALELAKMERKYAPLYWPLYHQLEAGEINEDSFYSVIHPADAIYYKHNDQLNLLVMQYFLSIYKQLFEIKK